jgi:hypothetical protein
MLVAIKFNKLNLLSTGLAKLIQKRSTDVMQRIFKIILLHATPVRFTIAPIQLIILIHNLKFRQ